MKPVQQLFALVLEEILQLVQKFPMLIRLKKEIAKIKKEYCDDEKMQTKIEILRCKEIKTLLFDEYLRIIDNKKNGNQPLNQYYQPLKKPKY